MPRLEDTGHKPSSPLPLSTSKWLLLEKSVLDRIILKEGVERKMTSSYGSSKNIRTEDAPVSISISITDGSMTSATSMPRNFKYRDVFMKGRPNHNGWDSFRIKHPPMPASRWAKIYAPFDALKGFSEAIAEKEEIYIQKPELSEPEKDELDRKLWLLTELTGSRKSPGTDQIIATIEYFEVMKTSDNGKDLLGKTQTITGQLSRIDIIRRSILIDNRLVDISDILKIESEILDDLWGE